MALFLPFKLADVSRSAYWQQEVFRQIRRKGVHHALVFHRTIVPAWLSWAYFPPPNSPRLDDDVLFVFMRYGADHVPEMLDLWQRHYPDREAWVFGWDKDKGPFLMPLRQFVSSADLTGFPLNGPR
jgi:hypothetical protein